MRPWELKQIFEEKAAALERGPKLERYEASCSVRDIMRCDVDVGGGKIISAGVPSVLGGDDSVPSPGQLMRAGLASCLALGYAVWAARLEVPVEEIDVTVHTIGDNRGPFVPGCSVHPGWLSMGYTIRMVSSAPEADLMRVIESADRQSPMLDNMNRGLATDRKLVVVPPCLR